MKIDLTQWQYSVIVLVVAVLLAYILIKNNLMSTKMLITLAKFVLRGVIDDEKISEFLEDIEDNLE